MAKETEIDKIIRAHWGTTAKFCDELKVTPGAVSHWRTGGIPKLRRFQIDALIAERSRCSAASAEQ